ncbi:MAG: isoprenylcysteine carboxylmethyltransferase family protein [Hyphomicrobiales bacterium]|nr:isoprenylcysteine carboxylmethyltransferase family protein [Hyphomicrobiales bacterium]
MDEIGKRPNVVPWPPILLTVSAAISIALGYLVPISILRNAATEFVGSLFIAVGIGLDLWAILTLKNARTTILPHRSASHLVTYGPFRFTRNPIYLGNTILMTGIGLAFGAGWFVISGIVSAFTVD